MRKIAALLVIGLAAPMLHAQARPGIVTISAQQCVWRAGDNPSWAAPSLDETNWQPYASWNPSSREPRLWIRCHTDLSPLRSVSHPAVQIFLYAAYDVFLDGRRIGTAGNVRTGAFAMNTVRAWPLSGHLDQSAVIALRVTRRIVSRVPVGAVPQLAIDAGDARLLRDRRSGMILAQVRPLVIPTICFSIIGILGAVLIPLWLNDRRRHELVLLAICCLSLPAIYLNYLGAAALVPFSVAAYILAWTIPAALVNVTRLLFFFAMARRRVPLVFWVLIVAGTGLYLPAAVQPLLPPAPALRLNLLFSHQVEAYGDIVRVLEEFAPFAAFLPWSRLTARMKPVALLSMTWGGAMMAFFAVRSTGTHIPGIPNLQANWGTAAADCEAVTVLSVVIALFFLLFRDQQQTARERAVLAGEMQAAQEVQRMLAAAVLDSAAGVRLDVAFRPIREVGGDFYSCRILPGNRQRILIGDVSGKGAAAAMTAAVLLGAAQRRDDESPGALLRHLNSVMADMHVTGFATCLCADLSTEGLLTVANAGHLSPYCKGQEIPLDSSLPLGIAADTAYSESTLHLTPNDQLTFLSDGVVEAQSPTGELFGFDRTAAISTHSAEEIARAAQVHGQQDDITVLTLQFAPAEVAHA